MARLGQRVAATRPSLVVEVVRAMLSHALVELRDHAHRGRPGDREGASRSQDTCCRGHDHLDLGTDPLENET